MTNSINALRHMSIAPSDEADFNSWLNLQDAIEFLQKNASNDEFVLYASLPNVYIHALLVPSVYVTPPDVDDLMSWQCCVYSGWAVSISPSPASSISICPPLYGTGSQTLEKGEQLVFAREFEGRVGNKDYFEVLQKFLHVSDLHYLAERRAYCRLDRHGDVEEVVRITDLPAGVAQRYGGVVVTVAREVLDRYATLAHSTIVCTFDFTRTDMSRFVRWTEGHKPLFKQVDRLSFRIHIETGHASYMRGYQLITSKISQEELMEEFHPGSKRDSRYESFIVHDWKNDVVREISCAPGATSNYFTQSELPFETSPAFFRPEVLSKYKADSEKYQLGERRLSCRGTWSLQTYDINDAGQVHTYLVYLRNMPYEEQLHWKAHNERPKETISHRAFIRDFLGRWDDLYDPLESIKTHVRGLSDKQVPWWTLHAEDAIDRSHYPVTASPDEWANEILHLHQLIVEPFEKKWFKNQTTLLAKEADARLGSLALTEICLTGWGQGSDEAKQIIAPLKILNELRSKLKGHSVGKSTQTQLRQQALNEHGSYKEHFRALCAACDKSLREITVIIDVLATHPI